MLAGLYFIFSFCVMWSLDDLKPTTAIEVMNKINVVIENPFFFGLFMGTPLLCVLVLTRRISILAIAGALVLLIGEFGVTAGINVPLNDDLAKFDHHDDAAKAWDAYSGPWTKYNTIRMGCSVIATVCFAWSLRQ